MEVLALNCSLSLNSTGTPKKADPEAEILQVCEERAKAERAEGGQREESGRGEGGEGERIPREGEMIHSDIHAAVQGWRSNTCHYANEYQSIFQSSPFEATDVYRVLLYTYST